MAVWTEEEGGVNVNVAWVAAGPVEVACEEDDPALEAAAAAWTAGEGVGVELHAAGIDEHDEGDMVVTATAAIGLPAADDEDGDGVAVVV